MYLIERLTSLCIFVAILFVICIAITRTRTKKQIKAVILFYLFLIVVMAYIYVPHYEADLTALIIRMRYYCSFDLKNFINILLSNSTPGEKIYYYLIGHLGNDKLLGTITALITFSFCFNIYLKILRYDNRVNKWDIAISLFLFMSRGLTLQIISNIRTTMALAIITWCIYQEFYRSRKTKSLLVYYLIACSLHTMGMVMVLYRIGYFFIEKTKSKRRKIEQIVLGIMLFVLMSVFGQKYINGIINKIYGYGMKAITKVGYYDYFWERILTVITLIICIYIICYFNHFVKKIGRGVVDKNLESTKKLVAFTKPLIILDIIAMFIEFSFFHRIGWFLSILYIPLFVYVSELGRIYNGKKNFKFQKRIIILSFIMLILACIRGDLCSLKFFIL